MSDAQPTAPSRSRGIGLAGRSWIFLLLLALTPPVRGADDPQPTLPESEAAKANEAGGEAQPAPGATSGPPPATRPAPAKELDAARLWGNFRSMMGDSWQEVALFIGKIMLTAVLWGVALGFVGIAVGIAAYLALRRHKLFDGPWTWYRYVAWVWPGLFALSMAAGFSYAGLWIGGGRQIRVAIQEENVLERVISNLFTAVALDCADYRLEGTESAEEMQEVLTQSEALGDLVREDFKNLLTDALQVQAGALGLGMAGRTMIHGLVICAVDQLDDILLENDPRLVLVSFAFMASVNGDMAEYKKQFPDARLGTAALSLYFSKVRKGACRLVDSLCFPNILLGFGVGLLAPGMLLGLYRLGLYLNEQRSVARDESPSPPPPAP